MTGAYRQSRHSAAAEWAVDAAASARQFAAADLESARQTAAAEALAKTAGRGPRARQQLVMDSMDNFDGLESLIAAGARLGGPASNLDARSCIYRAIARAQMLFIRAAPDFPGAAPVWRGFRRNSAGARRFTAAWRNFGYAGF